MEEEDSRDSLGSWEEDMQGIVSVDDIMTVLSEKYPKFSLSVAENVETDNFEIENVEPNPSFSPLKHQVETENLDSSQSISESAEVPLEDVNKDPDWMPLCEEENESDQEDSPSQTMPNVKNNNEDTGHITKQTVFDMPSNENEPVLNIGTIKKTRNKIAVRSEWIDNKQKTLREKGKTYTGWTRQNKKGKRGQEREERKQGPSCNSKFCIKSKQRKCQDIPKASRELMFTKFWETLSWDQKKIYVCSLVKKSHTIESIGEQSRRQFTLSYSLKTQDGCIYPVCKKMFLNSLGLKERSVLSWVKNSDGHGLTPSSDNVLSERKLNKSKEIPKRNPSKSQPKAILEKFLDDMPKLPSHYCRQSTNKKYIEPIYGNNMADVYNEYKKICFESADKPIPVSRFTFDKTIMSKNLAFQLPKKDRCDVCCMFDVKNIDDATYNLHLEKKQEARSEKEKDKQNCKEGKCLVFTQDLEAVKVCPSLNASALYYKTKLCNHNFTMYDLNSHKARCYWFSEADADLCANTFASCIVDYLSDKCDNTLGLPIILWSDGCTAQNRNATLSNALLSYSVDNNVEIQQKYLLKGHTQMEVDSVHASIERKLKNCPIYLPSDFARFTELASKNGSYEVKQLSFDFVKDFGNKSKLVYDSIRPGRRPGEPVVTDIKVIKYQPNGEIKVKINSFKSEFIDLPQRKKLPTVSSLSDFVQLHDGPLKINTRKWKDLQELKKVIPADCHLFYDSLLYED